MKQWSFYFFLVLGFIGCINETALTLRNKSRILSARELQSHIFIYKIKPYFATDMPISIAICSCRIYSDVSRDFSNLSKRNSRTYSFQVEKNSHFRFIRKSCNALWRYITWRFKSFKKDYKTILFWSWKKTPFRFIKKSLQCIARNIEFHLAIYFNTWYILLIYFPWRRLTIYELKMRTILFYYSPWRIIISFSSRII